MRINPIGRVYSGNLRTFTTAGNFQKSINNKPHLYGREKCDYLSFLGTNIFGLPMAGNKNVEQAVNLGRKITDLLQENAGQDEIKKLIKSEIQVTDVLDMDDYRKTTGDEAAGYCAYHTFEIDDDFNCKKSVVYVDFPSNSANRNPDYKFQQNFELARTIAHECTHTLQGTNGNYKKFMSKVADNSGEKATQLSIIANIIFQQFDTEMLSQLITPFVNKAELRNCRAYGRTIPREMKMSKGIFLSRNNLTQDAFNNKVNIVFNRMYSNFINLMKNGRVVFGDENTKKFVEENIKTEEARENLKNELKATCYYRAVSEQEAYTTESEIARTILKTDKMLNLDMFPIYFELLAEALSDNR